MEWYHRKLKRRIGKGHLPEFAEVYNDDENIKKLPKSHSIKIYRDIEKYDKANQQSYLSSGGRKKRRTKRRRKSKRRRKTKRRTKKRRKSKKRRR